MPYVLGRGWVKREYTNICRSDKCGKPFVTKWKIKQYCSQPCRARGAYLQLKAKQEAQGKNTRRIPKNPGIRIGLTPEEAREWTNMRRRENNRLNKMKLNQRCKDEPAFGWEKRLREKYKITAADYWRMWKEQDKGCAICGRETAYDDIKVLQVDHCHATSIVRGLLCFNCNGMLGQAKDRIEILKKAIVYLERFNVAHQP